MRYVTLCHYVNRYPVAKNVALLSVSDKCKSKSEALKDSKITSYFLRHFLLLCPLLQDNKLYDTYNKSIMK